jgi:hypothetical protein
MAVAGCRDAGLSPPQVIPNRSTIAAPADLDLTPQGVVGEQMKALADWYEDPDALGRVFSFASPGNRAVTGPAERFRRLVESDPYVPLVENQGYAIGSAVELLGRATVLVTLVDRTGSLVAYRFYLSRQKNEPKARWMVDAVYRFTPGAPASAAPDYPTI